MDKRLYIISSIIEYLRTQIEEEVNYYKIFLPDEKGIREKTESSKNKYPFILVTPSKVSESLDLKKGGMEIIIGVENQDQEKGLEELFNLAGRINKAFVERAVGKGYSVLEHSITENFEREMCYKNQYHMKINFDVRLQQFQSKLLEEM